MWGRMTLSFFIPREGLAMRFSCSCGGGASDADGLLHGDGTAGPSSCHHNLLALDLLLPAVLALIMSS
jgi:hypothetical protein